MGLIAWLFLLGGTVLQARGRPNIIVILADDMGFSDLGCTGAEIETPHLDRLARDGLLFTHFYNTSRCCPSRAALLTGQHQWDAGIGHMVSTKSRLPEYSPALNRESVTIAELLQRTGYQTFMSGKWHVGDAREAWPDQRGFDQFYGSPLGGGLYFYPSPFYDRPLFLNGDQVDPEPGWYSTDGFTSAAINFVTHRQSDKPFFLYLAYIAPHFPLQAKPEDIAKYRGRYEEGYEAIRAARFAKQQRLGIVPPDIPPSPPTFPAWDELEDPAHEAMEMAVYAAQVDSMDQNIGRLIATLEAEGILENTLIMFLSDNGAASADFNRTPKAELGTRHSNAAYGAWHNVSNTPYRLSKAREHEGGIITPLIAHWPEGIQRYDALEQSPQHITDVLPTLLEVAGTTYPASYHDHTLDPLDGLSFADRFTGPANSPPDRVMFWEHQGNRAVRRGDWKLVSLHQGPWQLHHLGSDPYEQIDLSAEHPKLAAELAEIYAAWADKHGVRPWPLSE